MTHLPGGIGNGVDRQLHHSCMNAVFTGEGGGMRETCFDTVCVCVCMYV